MAYATDGTVRWSYRFDGDPQALGYSHGVLYVGGHFDQACKAGSSVSKTCTAGQVPRVKLAAIDVASGALLDWNPTANGVVGVTAMTVEKPLDAIEAGGQFTTIGGNQVRRFAEFK
jgi:hypothetical protein